MYILGVYVHAILYYTLLCIPMNTISPVAIVCILLGVHVHIRCTCTY